MYNMYVGVKTRFNTAKYDKDKTISMLYNNGREQQ